MCGDDAGKKSAAQHFDLSIILGAKAAGEGADRFRRRVSEDLVQVGVEHEEAHPPFRIDASLEIVKGGNPAVIERVSDCLRRIVRNVGFVKFAAASFIERPIQTALIREMRPTARNQKKMNLRILPHDRGASTSVYM